MDEVAKLKAVVESGDSDEVLNILLEDAKAFVLAYTGRGEDRWLAVFDGFAREIAGIAYSRRGDEAVTAKKEGDLSVRYVEAGDLPRRVRRGLNMYRVLR